MSMMTQTFKTDVTIYVKEYEWQPDRRKKTGIKKYTVRVAIPAMLQEFTVFPAGFYTREEAEQQANILKERLV